MGSGYSRIPDRTGSGKPEFQIGGTKPGEKGGANGYAQPQSDAGKFDKELSDKMEIYRSETRGGGAVARRSGGDGDQVVVTRRAGEPPSGMVLVVDGIKYINTDEPQFSGGYISESFISGDTSISSEEDYKDISSPLDTFINLPSFDFLELTSPLLDVGINPSIPAIISSFTYQTTTLSTTGVYADPPDGISDSEVFDVYNDSVADNIYRHRLYRKAIAVTTEEASIDVAAWAQYMEPWCDGFIAGGLTSGAESKPAFQKDMYLAIVDEAYAAAVGANPDLPDDIHAALDYVEFDYGSDESGGHMVDTDTINLDAIDPVKSINLPLSQINYVQPYIAKELYLSAKGWQNVKQLIEFSSRVVSGTNPYIYAHGMDMRSEGSSIVGGKMNNYHWGLHNDVVPDIGYSGVLADISSVQRYYLKDMFDRTGGTSYSNRLKEFFTDILQFDETSFTNASSTQIYSQLVYDLYVTVRDGSWKLRANNTRFFPNHLRPSTTYMGETGGYVGQTLSAMKLIGGTSVSDDEIGDFIDSLPSPAAGSGPWRSISCIFGLLGRDWIQNIAMNNSVFSKAYNNIIASFVSSHAVDTLTDISDIQIDDSTTIDSLFKVIFDARTSMTEDDPPGPFSLMSAALKPMASGLVLPIESFCAEAKFMPPDVYTSGYEYFVEEFVAAAESNEEDTTASKHMYEFFGTNEIHNFPKMGSAENPIDTNTGNGYAPGFNWDPTSTTFIPNQILGDKPLSIMQSLTTLCLKHLTLNRAFKTVPLSESDTCVKAKISEFSPTTGFLYSSLLHKIADTGRRVLDDFEGIGTDSAYFNYTTHSAKRALELSILGYIASGTTALKTHYVRYCEELFKLKKVSEEFSSFEGSADIGMSFAGTPGAVVVQNTFDDDYISALNNVKDSSANFILACEILSEALFDTFSPKETLFGDEEPGPCDPFGDFSAESVDNLHKFTLKFMIDLNIEEESGSFNSILLTPVGSALTEAAIDSLNLIGITTEAIIDGNANMKTYAAASSATDDIGFEMSYGTVEGLISGSSLTGPAIDLLTPTRTPHGPLVLSTSDIYGFNALTYIRSSAIAYLQLIDSTITNYNYNISTDLSGDDFFGESTSASFLDDEIIECEISTRSMHSFFLGAAYAAGRCRANSSGSDFTYTTSETPAYVVTTLNNTPYDDQYGGGDETGDSHFIDDIHESMFQDVFRNAFYYPSIELCREDVVMLELYNNLIHVSNHWANIGKSIRKPNNLNNMCVWKKWLQFGAFNGVTREIGLLTSSESIKSMKHYIREFMSYGVTGYQDYQTPDVDLTPRMIPHMLTDSSGANYWLGNYDLSDTDAPYTYPMGAKFTEFSQSLIGKTLSGDYYSSGFPSGNIEIDGETVNMGTSLINETFDQTKKIITVGLPAGITDKMRREAYSIIGPWSETLKKYTNSMVRISIYKYDLEDDSIYYPEPMSFIVNTSMFSPTAFPDITADALLRSQSDKNLSSTSLTSTGCEGFLFDIPSLIGDPYYNRRMLSGEGETVTGAYYPKWTATINAIDGSILGCCPILDVSRRPGNAASAWASYKASGGNRSPNIGAFPTITTPDMLFYLTRDAGSAGTSSWGYYTGKTRLSNTTSLSGAPDLPHLIKRTPVHWFEMSGLSVSYNNYSRTVNGNLLQDAWDQNSHSWIDVSGGSRESSGNSVTGGVMISYDGSDMISFQDSSRELNIDRLEQATKTHQIQASINCTKDRILKEYMRITSGIDMREVGFPILEQDTDYRACTESGTGVSTFERRAKAADAHRPDMLISDRTFPSTLLISPAFLGAFLNFRDCAASGGAAVGRGADGLWGSVRGIEINTGCSAGRPLMGSCDIHAGQLGESARSSSSSTGPMGSTMDYFDYKRLKSSTINALNVRNPFRDYDIEKQNELMLKSYELGAPIHRSIATTPNKFERTFSFLIDAHNDFDPHRLVVDEIGTFTEAAPDHKSNLFGFYATIELVV